MTPEQKMPFRLLLAGTVAAFALVAAPAAADLFDEWDADTSGDLTSEEFSTGFYDTGVYDEWDADDDGLLSNDELGDSSLYDETWDANEDGLLDQNEFGDGYYQAYDVNDDQVIDDTEWSAFEEDADEAGWFDL